MESKFKILCQGAGKQKPPGTGPGGGLRHLAFCVESVEQTVKELGELGIECEPIRVDDYTGKKMTFFHDPDGLPLELHE